MVPVGPRGTSLEFKFENRKDIALVRETETAAVLGIDTDSYAIICEPVGRPWQCFGQFLQCRSARDRGVSAFVCVFGYCARALERDWYPQANKCQEKGASLRPLGLRV